MIYLAKILKIYYDYSMINLKIFIKQEVNRTKC